MSHVKTTSRRSFLKTTLATSAAIGTFGIRSATATESSDKVNLAIMNFLTESRVVA